MVLRVCAAICGAAILFVYSSSAMAKLETVGKSTAASRHDACAMGVTIVGTASMYNPFQPGYDEGGIQTASGELYDPIAWTAAIQTDLRETFGGVRHGKDYRPAYALVEVANRRAIIKINDVGPLKPGRVMDFNKQTMRYFDPTLQRGLVHSVKAVARRWLGNRPDQWVKAWPRTLFQPLDRRTTIGSGSKRIGL